MLYFNWKCIRKPIRYIWICTFFCISFNRLIFKRIFIWWNGRKFPYNLAVCHRNDPFESQRSPTVYSNYNYTVISDWIGLNCHQRHVQYLFILIEYFVEALRKKRTYANCSNVFISNLSYKNNSSLSVNIVTVGWFVIFNGGR